MKAFFAIIIIFLISCKTQNFSIGNYKCKFEIEKSFEEKKLTGYHYNSISFTNDSNEVIFFTPNDNYLFAINKISDSNFEKDSLNTLFLYADSIVIEGEFNGRLWKQIKYEVNRFYPSGGYYNVKVDNKNLFDKYIESIKCYKK